MNQTANCTKTILILVFCFYFGSLVLGQETIADKKVYQDSLQNEWWFPFVEKQGIELMDFLDYCQASGKMHIFINGKLETKNDTLTIFKNGIAFEKLQAKYYVYYFNSFQIGPIDYEVIYDKYEYYSIDSLLLLISEQHEGEFFLLRTDTKNNLEIMQTIKKD